jgi:predicted DNA-binding WGR domain protein
MPLLTKIDAARNLHRFYMVQLSQDLFGEWSLVREWGRIGSPGRVRSDTFSNESHAREAERRSLRLRERHGYQLVRE